jgi:hypothetical protein
MPPHSTQHTCPILTFNRKTLAQSNQQSVVMMACLVPKPHRRAQAPLDDYCGDPI